MSKETSDIEKAFRCGESFIYGLKKHRDPIIWELKYSLLSSLLDQKKITSEQHDELIDAYESAEKKSIENARISANRLFKVFSETYNRYVPKSCSEHYFRVDELNECFAIALECNDMSIASACELSDKQLLEIFQIQMAIARQIEGQAPVSQVGSQKYLDEMKNNEEFRATSEIALRYFNSIKNIDAGYEDSGDVPGMRLHGCLASMRAHEVMFILDDIKLSLSDSFGYTVHEFVNAYKTMRDYPDAKISFYRGDKLVDAPWENPSISNAKMFIADNTDGYIKEGGKQIPNVSREDIEELARALGDEDLELLNRTSNKFSDNEYVRARKRRACGFFNEGEGWECGRRYRRVGLGGNEESDGNLPSSPEKEPVVKIRVPDFLADDGLNSDGDLLSDPESTDDELELRTDSEDDGCSSTTSL